MTRYEEDTALLKLLNAAEEAGRSFKAEMKTANLGRKVELSRNIKRLKLFERKVWRNI